MRAEESNLREMTETKGIKPVAHDGVSRRSAKATIRRSSFKYYIHDGVDTCRLQLIGEFTEREVSELDGSWRTAKTILGKRALVLDLRGVTGVDEAGKRWLASMASEGACYLPESFLQKCISGMPLGENEPASSTKMSFFGRLLASLRGLASMPRSRSTSSTPVR